MNDFWFWANVVTVPFCFLHCKNAIERKSLGWAVFFFGLAVWCGVIATLMYKGIL